MDKMDNLFKKDLGNYEKAAPATAWNRIEDNLNKKSNGKLWLKIAAGVIGTLLISVTAIHLSEQKTVGIAEVVSPDKGIDSAGSENNTDKTNAVVQQPSHPDALTSESDQKPGASTADHTKKKNDRRREKTVHRINTANTNSIATTQVEAVVDNELITEQTASPVIVASTDENDVKETVVVDANEEKAERENVTIVYTVEEVNAKYFNKEAAADATRENEKSSTLRKVLEKAYDLKHNQDPFGELRQKKNEILALNFKNEKERSQNR